MIKNPQALWKRTVEISKEVLPEYFANYPFASDLRLGWYPGAAFFEPEAMEVFFKSLPDVQGAVFPYHHDFGTLSHLAIIPYNEDGTLNHKRKAVVTTRGSRVSRLSGIFGVHRLKIRQPSLVLTDDELLVCRFNNVVAVSNPSPRTISLIKRSTLLVNLKSDNPKWIAQMYSLAKHGFQVAVNDRPLVDHIADALIEMLHDRLGLSIITDRVQSMLSNLVPLERLAVIQLVKQATNVNLEQVLPDEFRIYNREAEFYDSVQLHLDKLFSRMSLDESGLWVILDLTDGRKFTVPFNKLSVGAAVCEAASVPLDLMDWARRDLKEVPHFYLYRTKDQMETRAKVCDAIADVVMAIVSRRVMASAAR